MSLTTSRRNYLLHRLSLCATWIDTLTSLIEIEKSEDEKERLLEILGKEKAMSDSIRHALNADQDTLALL